MTSSASNREFEFLCACVRRFLNRHSPLPDSSQIDWTALIEMAREHLTLPLLAWVLDPAGGGMAPVEAQCRLRESFQSTARSNLALSAELVRLLAAFRSAGLSAVPLKGPTLAEHLYGDVTLRSFSDLDLLIQPPDVLRSRALLDGLGYRLTSSLHWNSDRAVLRSRDSQLSFSEPGQRIPVDVHWRLLPEYYPTALESQHIWRDLRSVSFAGRQIPALAAEHLLLFLSAHGAKHHWERFGWICDVACLIRVEKSLDWDGVWRESERSGTTRMLAVSLLLAQELAGAHLPDGVSRQIAKDTSAGSLFHEIRARLAGRTPGTITALESARFAWRIFGRRKALSTISGIFFAPTEAEYRVLQLPSPLFGLYYPFRLLRISSKFAARALRLGRSKQRRITSSPN